MQPQRQTNPWMIVLGVCGGCAVLGIILFVVVGAITYNKSKDLVQGAISMQQNMPKFLNALKSKDYNGAAALIDPSAQDKLNAESLKKLEEQVEGKLGPLQSFPAKFSGQEQSTTPDPAGKQIGGAEWKYSYHLTYEKGSATATFSFRTADVFHPSGLITDFKLQPDGS